MGSTRNKVTAWIFANTDTRFVSGKKIAALPIKRKDFAIFCNTPVSLLDVKQKCRKLLYLRGTPGHDHYFGEELLHETSHMYEKVFYLEGDRDSDAGIIVEDYPAGKKPSTGFLLFLLYEHLTDAVLVNFIGPKRDKKDHWDGHDFEYEQHVYKKRNVTMIECLK